MSVVIHPPSSEASPLLPRETKHSGISTCRLLQVVGCIGLLILQLFLGYHTYGHFTRCPPDPATRDAIRQDWENEKYNHDVLQHEWEHRQKEQSDIEEGWRRNAEEHERGVARREREEQLRQERVRLEWMHEVERHKLEFEEIQRREREERERERERWRQELEERDQREEEERQKRHMFWGHPEAHTCTTYATREYTAQLMNLPTSWNHPLDACRATPLEIHGISHLPTTCEQRGPGVMIGRWVINQQEPDCTPFWDSHNDKGCTSPGSGKKYITHKLENLPENSDWREFCATTPASFNNMQFPGAQECFPSIWGIYGQWELDDSNC